MTLHLGVVGTVVAALLTIELGRRLNRARVWLERGSIPPSVSAGLFVSLILAGLRSCGWIDVRFDAAPRDVLLLVFIASLGFGAHLGRLATAGRGALVICLGIALTIVSQNVAGVLIAKAFGEKPELGLFLGSIAYAGGHGTGGPVERSIRSRVARGIRTRHRQRKAGPRACCGSHSDWRSPNRQRKRSPRSVCSCPPVSPCCW